ncbi:MAG: TetR family transcriptional regulator [Rhodospirillaceae bacterium]|nr:MAG: TetR family transcriptional regulator [Rhodospirillaceae bacterium]
MPLTSTQLERAFATVEDRGWSRLTLTDLATALDVSLVELRAFIGCKYDLIPALNASVDETVLKETSSIDLSDSPRDRLFEVMMARFDALGPYRQALGILAFAARSDLRLAAVTHKHLVRSMGWMLEAAGLGDGGFIGQFRQNGLMLVYVRASMAWLKDESTDLSATMKALDQALEDAERWANSVESRSLDGLFHGLGRFCGDPEMGGISGLRGFAGIGRSGKDGKPTPDEAS